MYTIEKNDYVIQSAEFPELLFFRDEYQDDFDREELTKHFKNVHSLLTTKVSTLADGTTSISHEEEKELHLIIDALIQTKRLLEDNSD